MSTPSFDYSSNSTQLSPAQFLGLGGRTLPEGGCLTPDETEADRHEGAGFYHGNAGPKKSLAREMHMSMDKALRTKSQKKNEKPETRVRIYKNKSHEKKEKANAKLALKTLKIVMAYYDTLQDEEVVDNFNAPDHTENGKICAKKCVLSRIQSIFNTAYLCENEKFTSIDARRQLCMYIQLRDPDLTSQALDALYLILERHFIELNESNASCIFKDFLYFSRIMAIHFPELNRTNKIKSAKVFALFAEIVRSHQKALHTHAMHIETRIEIARVCLMMRLINKEIEDLVLHFYTSLAAQAIARIVTDNEIVVEVLERGYHIVKAAANAYVKNAPGTFTEIEAAGVNLLLSRKLDWGKTVLKLRKDFRISRKDPEKMVEINKRIENLLNSKKWKYAYAAADLITLQLLFGDASGSTEEDLRKSLNQLQDLSRVKELPKRSPLMYIIVNGKRLKENEHVPNVNTNEGVRIAANKALNRISLFATDPEIRKIARKTITTNFTNEDFPKVKKVLERIIPDAPELKNWVTHKGKYEGHNPAHIFEKIAFANSKETGKIISDLINFGEIIADPKSSKHSESEKLDSKRVKKEHHKSSSHGSSHKKERHKHEKSDGKKPEKENNEKKHKSSGHKSHKKR